MGRQEIECTGLAQQNNWILLGKTPLEHQVACQLRGAGRKERRRGAGRLRRINERSHYLCK